MCWFMKRNLHHRMAYAKWHPMNNPPRKDASRFRVWKWMSGALPRAFTSIMAENTSKDIDRPGHAALTGLLALFTSFMCEIRPIPVHIPTFFIYLSRILELEKLRFEIWDLRFEIWGLKFEILGRNYLEFETKWQAISFFKFWSMENSRRLRRIILDHSFNGLKFLNS